MSKSSFESQYEKFITYHISNLDICPAQRAALFLDFYRSGRTYYDDLCDLLYNVCSGDLRAPLWMSNSGKIYASPYCIDSQDLYLADCLELPVFSGDLVESLDYIFSKIYSLSRNL